MNKLQAANHYIEKNKGTVNNRPFFHFTAQIGWLNDPNGFTFYDGKYHLFYQHNPYDIVWNNMHWGHATTNDFINWEYQPIALANDKIYDANGCFSGSAIEKDGNLYLMYTGHIDPNLGYQGDVTQIKQYQCIAYSEDGIHFTKHQKNPVIAEKELPEGYMICDFRDPNVIEIDGVYYCVLAVRNKDRRGEIIMYKSANLVDWTFHSSLYQTKYEENIMLECPDLFQIDGKDVLTFSIMPCGSEYAGEIYNKTAYAVGKIDYEKGEFFAETEGLLDYGRNFYAPQSTEGKNGERLMIGWLQQFNQERQPKDYGFNGMMSIPRELRLKDNNLVQQPYQDMSKTFDKMSIYDDVKLGVKEEVELGNSKVAYLQLDFSAINNERFNIEVNKEGGKSTRITVDVRQNTISLESDYEDGNLIAIPDCFHNSDDELKIEVFLDLHSIEVFVNSGEKVLSFISYQKEKGDTISIKGLSETEIKKLTYGTLS
ncbi:glycosyl hydrolase [Bacillus sp. J14TS2]|uniref:glycoside hydrolase family 32 protein n=1 Tax=Bacillus sp. J14TS2 TaxID=2807188 RepID=UPI001B118A9D|nr:sucrose-6-phosphate hydrolase [Bacillus sp. J14TS2]GIN74212.1 glycosyl hydrolase [Bacillus sp. J14TS2]